MALTTSQQSILSGGTTPTGSGGQFLSGGAFSDLLDVLTVPSYVVAGVLDPTKTIGEAVRTRTSVADVLGIKNPFAAFAVDVFTDPLTYTGIGALTKFKGVSALKKGTLAATLGGQAAKGERALLTAFGRPVIKGQATLEAATVASERLKQAFPAYSNVIEKLGGRGALTSISGDLTIGKIEEAAGALKITMDTNKAILREAGTLTSVHQSATDAASRSLDDIIKRTGEGKDELVDQILGRFYKNTGPLRPDLEDIYTRLKKTGDDLGVSWKKAGKDELGGYIFPSVLKNEADMRAAGKRTRELGGKSAKEKLRSYSGLTNGKVTLGARIAKGGSVDLVKLGDDAIELTNRDTFEKIGDVYVSSKTARALRDKGSALKLVVRELEADIKATSKIKTSINAETRRLEKQLTRVAKKKDEDSIAAASSLRKQIEFNNLSNKNTALEVDELLERMADIKDLDGDSLLQKFIDNNPDRVFRPVEISLDDRNKVYEHFTGRKDAFSKNPFQLQKVRAHAVGKATARANFIDHAKGIGVKLEKGQAVPPGMTKSSLDELKGFVFPEEAVKHMDKTYVRYQNFEEIGPFFAAFDKTQNLLKGTLTYTNIAFHTRNVVSNIWQMSYAMPVHKAFTETLGAFDLQRRVSKGFKQGDYRALLDKEEIELVDELLREGIIHSGAFTADIEGAIARAQDNILFNAGRALGGTLEDMSKIGMYKYMKGQGFTAQAAASEVRKYLFDYGDLTAFERNTLKRAFPFYTWTRKNIPLQLAMLVQKPGKFTRLQHFRDSLEGWAEGKPMPDRYMPEWLKEAMPIYIGTGDDGMQKFIKLEGFIPAVDINLLSRPLESLFEQFTPLIKTPAELIMNYDTFKERTITDYPGQRERFLGAYVPPAVEKVLSTIRPINELNKLFGLNNTKDIPAVEDRIMNFLIGKTYDFNLSKQKKTFDYIQTMREGQIKRDIEGARNKGAIGEITRLYEELAAARRGEDIKL